MNDLESAFAPLPTPYYFLAQKRIPYFLTAQKDSLYFGILIAELGYLINLFVFFVDVYGTIWLHLWQGIIVSYFDFIKLELHQYEFA